MMVLDWQVASEFGCKYFMICPRAWNLHVFVELGVENEFATGEVTSFMFGRWCRRWWSFVFSFRQAGWAAYKVSVVFHRFQNRGKVKLFDFVVDDDPVCCGMDECLSATVQLIQYANVEVLVLTFRAFVRFLI